MVMMMIKVVMLSCVQHFCDPVDCSLSGSSVREIFQARIQECLVIQLYLTLRDPMDCSPPGSSVHGILQARVLEWVAISFCKGSS